MCRLHHFTGLAVTSLLDLNTAHPTSEKMENVEPQPQDFLIQRRFLARLNLTAGQVGVEPSKEAFESRNPSFAGQLESSPKRVPARHTPPPPGDKQSVYGDAFVRLQNLFKRGSGFWPGF